MIYYNAVCYDALMDFGTIARLNYSLVLFGLKLSASIVLGDPLLDNRAIGLTSPTLEVSTVSTNPLNSH
jgi:hypothetical protein